MTNSKSTKRALLTSVISLMLCFAMLLGTTFAWFTDNASSVNNVIVSGNLDVELEYSTDFATWNPVKADTNIFKDALWEPGYTEVVYLRVSNLGNLAMKYKLGVNVASETPGKTRDNDTEFKLSDFIEYGVVTDVTSSYGTGDAGRTAAKNAVATPVKLNTAYEKEFNLTGKTATTTDTDTYALVVYMPESVTNEANHNGTNVPKINLGIDVYATQLASEVDSFSKDYDAGAKYDKPVVVKNVAELKEAVKDGGNIMLDDNIELTETLMPTKDTVIDLNGKRITASASSNLFQSQSNAEPSMIITSSADGAEINVSGGDTAVLLGYGSTVIKNVTINVKDGDKSSPNPFNVYGDLTLGEGTVVNVDYLGTALISNNGAVDIVIDGAKINIGTYKTNGGSIITLNKASTLNIKNTDIKIDNFVLSPFGGDKLVDKLDGVTIEGCTFDVTGDDGNDYTFVADNEKGRYSLKQI